MKKIIVLPLLLCSFLSFADLVPTTDVPPYPEYLSAYVKTLMIAGCKQTLKGYSEDQVIKQATQGMKEGTESYNSIYNTVILGAGAGKGLKERGKLITKDNVELTSCDKFASYVMTEKKDLIKAVVAGLVSPTQSQKAVAESKATTSDSNVYRTTAKDLAAMYKENEVAADDEIGGRKVEVTGIVQDITKNFANDVIVRFESGNQFMPASLSMEDTERLRATKLKKGQKITIICEKMQLFIGSPSGRNCTFN
ncbi:OB-fold putative lipoprotein [Escherichia coli]|uniref:OB-fold putative lipoprotein n=1 Tax=Escherichia coli TaxID=562 RepID=UPI001FF5C12D|nr:OB-fold putative lipoprotein [Escherichia coli]EKG5202693.1 hypothetical protein [Escherichia coli]MCK0851765.1 OB-fold putative lipoprotein [Escherichia coli]